MKIKVISGESLKVFIFIATTAAGVTLYAHEKFATNKRVDSVVESQEHQNKVSCLIAMKIGVNKSQLLKICKLEL